MTEQQKEVSLRLGFHRTTPYAMAEQIRAALNVCPQCCFENLKYQTLPRLFYIKSDSSYSQAEILVVHSITTKGGRATASRWLNPTQFKIYKRSYKYEKFYALTGDLINLLGVTHEQIVTTAAESGLDIPVQVRILYPEFFVEIPAGIDQERVRKALSPDWVRIGKNGIYTTPETVAKAIEYEHGRIAIMTEEKVSRLAKEDAKKALETEADYDSYIKKHRDNIEFYRWLEPFVQPGAVFGTGKKLSDEPYFDKDKTPKNFVVEVTK